MEPASLDRRSNDKEPFQIIPDWNDLTCIASQIRSAFLSLNPGFICKGLLLFDKKSFTFDRRSWTDIHLLGSISTWGDKRATFEGCRAGFFEILNRAKIINETVTKYFPKEEDLTRARDFLLLLTEIQTTIVEVTGPGISQLCLNYTNSGKLQQAACIRALGQEAFRNITKCQKKLEAKLTPRVPNLKVDLELRKYTLEAEPLLAQREQNIVHLRSVDWKPDHGVTIPMGLVRDCLRDKNCNPSKAGLKSAVCLLQLPTFAKEIPTLNGMTAWKPIRLTCTSDFTVIQEKGVIGTCERNNLPSDNLCNLYYKPSPLIMSCGAINTTRKAAQLAFAMKLICGTDSQKKRFVVHQLNSFFKEKKLIDGVHANIALNERYFQEKLENPELSFLHFNTCFNAATMFKSEDSQSLKNVNIDGLGRLASFVLTDVKQLLKTSTLSFLLGQNSTIDSEIEKAERLAETIIETKKMIHSLEENEHHRDKMSLSMSMLKDRDLSSSPEKVPDVDGSTVKPGLGAINGDSEETDFYFVDFTFGEETPQNVEQFKKTLSQTQEELVNLLKTLTVTIHNTISELVSGKKKDSTEFENALLILNVFEKILALQLKMPGYPPLSRSTEIELFLFLYRLLNITPVIICFSGLDRSGAARALNDSLIQMEENIFNGLLEEYIAKNDLAKGICRIEARKKIFHLITQADRNRKELFSLLNLMRPQPKFVVDLSNFDEGERGTKVRERLFECIDQKYPANASTDGEYLKYTLEYFELIMTQLLAVEAEKTHHSSGAIGLKYHFDAQGPKSYFANFHILDRMAPFIFVGEGENKKAIKLADYYEGWWSTTNITTNAANDILLRLSKLRGN